MGAENIIDMLSKIEKERKPEKTERKRKVPEKTCPDCNSQSHARASNCKECGYQFYEKKRAKQERLAENWRELKKGDLIKCIAGHGCYWQNKETGEKVRLGHKGTFEVQEIYYKNSRSCGILGVQIYTRGRRAHTREYIYMGESYYDDSLSTHKEPHKIIVIRKNDEKS